MAHCLWWLSEGNTFYFENSNDNYDDWYYVLKNEDMYCAAAVI